MVDGCSKDVEVLRDQEGWAVTCGGQWLKRFTGDNEFQALGRACQWSSKYAEAQGVAAWFVQAGLRTPITVGSVFQAGRAGRAWRDPNHEQAG